MNSRAVLIAQAIRGPVVLIIVGVLFAIHQAGVLPFSRTWPLIIITFGILKLIERMAMPQQQPPLPPPGGVR
ncbi:MAG: hypothetical protein JO145_00945 [Acidobacteriaceae bacterium]|nr:hypothetical protein [Acidobacteriaceae bacterium]MBV9766962.1 hypothetical protein [Acidobacteriaceae bacterium]